jgi:uncharacterized membrane protein
MYSRYTMIKYKMIKKSGSNEKYAIYLIIILAILLRMYNINAESVWTDESISVQFGVQSLKDIFWNTEPTPPLHHIILHFWIEMFGISAIAIRSLSLIFGVASVYMIYLVGNLINKKIGIYAAALLAINPISILYSQEARAYTLLFFTSLLSMYFYIKYLKNDSKSNASLYIISSVLMIYTHVFGIFIILAQNIHYLSRHLLKKRDWKLIGKWMLAQVITIILFMPWLLNIRNIIADGHTAFLQSLAKPTLFTILELFKQFSTGIVTPMFGTVLILILIVLIILFLLSKEKKSVLILWLIIPLIIAWTISLLWVPIYSTRHASFIVIPLLIIIAAGLNTLPKKIKIFTFSTIVILTLGCVVIQQNTHTKDDWKSINEYIIGKNVDQTAIMSWYEALPLSYYYYPYCMLTEKSHDALYACLRPKGLISIKDSEDLDFVNAKKVLLITSRLENTPKSEYYINILKERYDFDEDITFYAYNKTIFTNRFFNTIEPEYPAFNKVTIYTLTRK